MRKEQNKSQLIMKNLVSHKMKIKFNEFGSSMKNSISNQVSDTDHVSKEEEQKEDGGKAQSIMVESKQFLKWQQLSHGILTQCC